MQSGLACSAVWTSKSALPCTAVEDIRHYCPSRLLITLTQSLGRLYIAASAALLQQCDLRHTHKSCIECSIGAGSLLSGNGILCAIVAPSAPWGEFDGFPGRRERPSQCRHTTIGSRPSTYPTLVLRHAIATASGTTPSRRQPKFELDTD